MDKALVLGLSAVAAGLMMSFAAIGAAVGDSIVASRTIDGVARQPEALPQLRTLMLIGIGLVEVVPIASVGFAAVLLFANPLITLLNK